MYAVAAKRENRRSARNVVHELVTSDSSAERRQGAKNERRRSSGKPLRLNLGRLKRAITRARVTGLCGMVFVTAARCQQTATVVVVVVGHNICENVPDSTAGSRFQSLN